jgi:hypothetical protein
MNKDKLDYIGIKPEYKDYEDISKEDYNNIPINNWNVKDYTLFKNI